MGAMWATLELARLAKRPEQREERKTPPLRKTSLAQGVAPLSPHSGRGELSWAALA